MDSSLVLGDVVLRIGMRTVALDGLGVVQKNAVSTTMDTRIVAVAVVWMLDTGLGMFWNGPWKLSVHFLAV
jgi:hypothetical protein